MAFEANELAKTIVSEVAVVQKSRPGAIDPAVVDSGFCGIWPKAKPILELLAGIAIFIPGVGATAGAVLQGLIKVGDQISSQVCK